MTSDQNHNCAESVLTLRTIEVDAQSDPRWEALVSTMPKGLIYHHPAWLQVLEEAYGYKPVSLACEDANGQLLGILPLFYTRGLLSGSRFSSLPRTPLAGPLACDDRVTTALVRAAVEKSGDDPRSQLQLKVLSNALDGIVEGVVGVPWKATYLLSLPERPELLHLDSPVKRAVNKATKQGVEVCQAETERELRAWYELYLDTMRRVTMLPRPYRFFKVAWERLQPRGLLRLLLARRYEAGQPRLLAGSLFLMFGQTVFYTFAGWRWEDQSLRPNDAIHWRAIQDACADGFRWYDFGEVDKDDPGLAAFKRKWGSEEKWLYRYYYPAPREVEIGIFESARQTAFVNAAWRRLPIKVTALLSSCVHHYL